MRAMTTMAVFAAAGALAACGFDCEVQDETEHFADCAALQSRYDELSAETDAAARDDLLTCSEIVGCEVQP